MKNIRKVPRRHSCIMLRMDMHLCACADRLFEKGDNISIKSRCWVSCQCFRRAPPAPLALLAPLEHGPPVDVAPHQSILRPLEQPGVQHPAPPHQLSEAAESLHSQL
mmetsp:Transcript_51448/g.94117  ORF Transcript_51448/g.94117 Transcript_51448/m.94117 type:complete len:107 (+) Transcript_51448:32-352(+)